VVGPDRRGVLRPDPQEHLRIAGVQRRTEQRPDEFGTESTTTDGRVHDDPGEFDLVLLVVQPDLAVPDRLIAVEQQIGVDVRVDRAPVPPQLRRERVGHPPGEQCDFLLVQGPARDLRAVPVVEPPKLHAHPLS
jgi:hypothetical protein